MLQQKSRLELDDLEGQIEEQRRQARPRRRNAMAPAAHLTANTPCRTPTQTTGRLCWPACSSRAPAAFYKMHTRRRCGADSSSRMQLSQGATRR